MPGAWELPRRPNVLVWILTRELVTSRWANSFRSLQLPANSDMTMVAGMPYDHARNSGVETMLAKNFEWIFFLDDDVVLPADSIHRLLASNQPIMSGMYFRRHEPVAPCAMINVPGGRTWVTQWEPDKLFSVDFVGAGCLLIHNSVFAKVKYPWFDWTSDRKDLPEKERMSEDFSFCEKARTEGYKIVIDPRIQCVHAGLSEMSIQGVKPLKLT